jgi:hypothetical protein
VGIRIRQKFVFVDLVLEDTKVTVHLVPRDYLRGTYSATRLAWRHGFVKRIDGQELWHLKTYISMVQSHYKVQKLLKQGRPIARAAYERALI